MSMKKRTRERIEVNLNGVTYSGERIIEGTRKLDQYVVYHDQCVPDLKGYPPDQRKGAMLSIAKTILSELVSGRTVSAQPRSKFGL
jgi:hypothetical protein